MDELVALKCSGYDSATIRNGDTKAEFFHDVDSSVESAASLTEAELVDWILKNRDARRILLECIGLDHAAKVSTRVVDPFIQGGCRPGDIDLLACGIESPHEAVAIEFKRIKVVTTEKGDNVYRVQKAFEKVESQIGGLNKLGFSRTFLGLILVVDGRSRTQNNFMARGVSTRTFSRMLSTIDGLTKPEGVGAIYIEVSQPVSKSLDEACHVCMYTYVEATPRLQHGDISDRVKNYMGAV